MHNDYFTLGYFKYILLRFLTFIGEMFWTEDLYFIRSKEAIFPVSLVCFFNLSSPMM